MGSMNWHGPHHVAQKSTSTGLLPPIISSKFFSPSSTKPLLAACMLAVFLSSLMSRMSKLGYLLFKIY
jgi:predicted amidohydrolase